MEPFDTLNARVNAISQRIDALTQAVINGQQDLHTAVGHLDALETRIDALQGSLQQGAQGITTLGQSAPGFVAAGNSIGSGASQLATAGWVLGGSIALGVGAFWWMSRPTGRARGRA